MQEDKINLVNQFLGKGSKKKNNKGKGFGYQVLGFGSGVAAGAAPFGIDYLVVAGGGSGASNDGTGAAGAGAGGYRNSFCNSCAPTLCATLCTTYKVTIGAGGAGLPSPAYAAGRDGNPSSWDTCGEGTTITSAKGGKGVSCGAGGHGA